MKQTFETTEAMKLAVERALEKKHKSDVLFRGWKHINYWLRQATITDWVFIEIDKSSCKCEIRPDSKELGKVIIKVVSEDAPENPHVGKAYRIDFTPEVKNGMLFV